MRRLGNQASFVCAPFDHGKFDLSDGLYSIVQQNLASRLGCNCAQFMKNYDSVKVSNVNPQTTAAPEGGYSHGILVEGAFRQLFISGQIPESRDGEIPIGFEAQCIAVWNNIGEVLADAGMTFENVVKVTTYLTNADLAETNSQIRRRILGDLRPALTVVVAQTLDSRWLLEIEAIAVAPA